MKTGEEDNPEEYDQYSLPVQGRGGPESCRSPKDRIKQGLYPYSHGSKIVPPDLGIYSGVHRILRDLFSLVFEIKCSKREFPTAERWFFTLDAVYHSWSRCLSYTPHWYLNDGKGCPWCKKSRSELCLFLPSRVSFFPPHWIQILPRVFLLKIPHSSLQRDEQRGQSSLLSRIDSDMLR
jgi:hypothetical protein